MASIGVIGALGWRVRKARALRFLAMVFAVVALACVIAPDDARAQSVCSDPAPPNENVSCTITGSFSGLSQTEATGIGNATTNVSGNGTVSVVITQASGTGNATTNNAGFAGAIVTEADQGGNAATNNSGLVGVIQTYTRQQPGSAITTNFSGGIAGNITTYTEDGGNATILNYGVIVGDINIEAAINNGSGTAAFSNYGTAWTGFGGLNVLSYTGNASFTNSGTIDASFGLPPAAFDTGIFVGSMDGNATAYNNGRILGGIAVVAGGFSTATLTNAGLIDGTKSPFGVAIDMTQYDPSAKSVLNIMPGSRIIGDIILSGYQAPIFPGTTVNFYSGNISSITTFGAITCGCGEGGLNDTPSVVNVIGGAPFVIDRANNTVAILDPTSFAAQDRNVLDFTRTVLSAASSRLTSPTPMSGDGSAAIGFAPSGNVARDMANDAFANIPALSYVGQDRVLRSNPNFTAADGTSVWAQGFGGVRVQSADGPNLRSVNQFYGGILGLDKMVRPDMRLGGFVGGGSVTSQIDMNSGRTTSDTGFGGVYGRYAMSNKAFLDFALLAGGSSNAVKRTMTNNFVPGGYEYASANYSSWFISPELAYGVKQDLAKNWTVTPTARVRYLAAGFGGYQESGSSNNITVAGRTTHNFEERGELVFTRTTSEREGSLLQINGTVGALAWQRAGDAGVNTILLGQALAFATPGKANVFGGYAGGGFNWRQASGFSVFGAAEVTAMTDSSHTITGHGGVKLAF